LRKDHITDWISTIPAEARRSNPTIWNGSQCKWPTTSPQLPIVFCWCGWPKMGRNSPQSSASSILGSATQTAHGKLFRGCLRPTNTEGHWRENRSGRWSPWDFPPLWRRFVRAPELYPIKGPWCMARKWQGKNCIRWSPIWDPCSARRLLIFPSSCRTTLAQWWF